MQDPIFKVKLAKSKQSILGYEWIEVLTIVPWAITTPKNEHHELGEWAAAHIKTLLVCRTEVGIVQITDTEFWDEVGTHVYVEDRDAQ